MIEKEIKLGNVEIEIEQDVELPFNLDDLKSYAISQYQQANIASTEIMKERDDNLEYYENRSNKDKPKGNRSQVQTSDIADHVDWLHSEIMEMLYSGVKPVEFIPFNAQDIEQAKQETLYCDNVINQQNDGFSVYYTWIKDALIQKNGIVKVYWDRHVNKEQETYENLSHVEYLRLLDDKQVRITEHTLFLNGEEQPTNEVPAISPMLPPQIQVAELQARLATMTHNVKLVRENENAQIRIENIAPENFRVRRNQNSLSLKDTLFCSQVERKTRGELLNEGFDYDDVMALPSYDEQLSNEESSIRYRKEGAAIVNIDNSGTNELAQEVQVIEAYCYYDINGDKELELVKIIMGGGVMGKVLDWEQVDSIPYIAITPYINAYRFYGTCPADRVKQIQRAKTSVTRQILDNLYSSNNPQPVVNMAKLDDGGIEALKTTDIGAIIPVTADGAISFNSTPFVAAQSLPILELLDEYATRRTGANGNGQGIDPSMLKDQSMFIGSKIMQMSQRKVSFLARTISETGIKELFLKIHELTLKYEKNPRIFDVNGKYTEVDPRSWRKRDKMRVMVGTGNNNNDVRLSAIQQVIQLQKDAIAAGGLNSIVTAENIYNTLEDYVELMGLRSVDRYFMNPQQAEPQSEEPSETFKLGMADIQQRQQAKMIDAQLESKKIEIQAAETQAKLTTDRTKLTQDAAFKQKDIALEQEKIDLQKKKIAKYE